MERNTTFDIRPFFTPNDPRPAHCQVMRFEGCSGFSVAPTETTRLKAVKA